MKHLTYFLSLAAFCYSFSELSAQETYLSKVQLVKDLILLEEELMIKHPNLYTYSSPKEIKAHFDNLKNTLPDQLTSQEAFIKVATLASVLKDGHSYIYPSAQILAPSTQLFPLEVILVNDQLIVTHDYSGKASIPTGAILQTINELPIAKIQKQIVSHTVRDGDNLGYPQYIFYQFFPAFYSFFYGSKAQFSIKYQDLEGQQKEMVLQGMTGSQLQEKKQTLQIDNQAAAGLFLTIHGKDHLAVLTIKSFDQKILKQDFQQNFKKEIKAAFQKIEENKIKYLAIDLRGNQGGNVKNGVFLLQQIMNNSFKVIDALYRVKTEDRKLKKLNTKWDKEIQNKKQAFAGQVYLLTNGGSFSCSAIVANAFKNYSRGQIIGEMTGGSAYTNTGGPNKTLVLPNSKVLVTIPQTQFRLKSELSKLNKGVIPDFPVSLNRVAIIEGKDVYLEKLKAIIQP